MFELNGRIAVITGGGGGIGGATAGALARRGATVVLADISDSASSLAAELGQAGFQAHAYKMDVTDPHEWKNLMAWTSDEFGRLDALVNAAGILRPKPFEQATLAELDTTLDINVRSVWLGSHSATELMVETARTHAAKPSIVNVSSIYGIYAGVAHVAYSVSKGAVRMLSKGMAQELARHQIRVNTVFPGPVNTPLMTGSINSLAEFGLRPAGEAGLDIVAKAHPMGRMAEPADIAGAIVFLCCDASSFMTGGELIVDGGLTLT